MKLNHQFINSQLAAYHSANRIIIAYSGGVDSHVLLHLLASIPELKYKLFAIYVHHGLQASAEHWAKHCQGITNNLAVKFQVLKVNAQAMQGQSPEEAARDARYQAFKQVLKKNDLLLFAQHRDDQLETVLLQLFRGAGLKGLSGMPAAINFGAGLLVRPLLDIDQQEIKQYAQQQDLQWVEDPSNQDIQFDRNYLRHEIVPLLKQRWPSLDKIVARVAEHCAGAQTLLSNSAKQKMHTLYDPDKQCLCIKALQEHEPLTQQLIIREWLDLLGARMPSQKVMNAIIVDILNARPDANPLIEHDACNIRRYRGGLYLVIPIKIPDLNELIAWADNNQPLNLPDNGQLKIKDASQGIAKTLWMQGRVEVKYRQGGEKIALFNRNGRHSLKKLYQEEGIAPWLRDVIPLVYINGTLAAIADYWISADFYGQNEACVQLFWERQGEVVSLK